MLNDSHPFSPLILLPCRLSGGVFRYVRQTFRAAPAERDRHELINLLFKFGELIFYRS